MCQRCDLTDEQHGRLDQLPDDTVVIAKARRCPILRTGAGRLMRLGTDGTLARAGVQERTLAELREVDLHWPRLLAAA